MIGSWDYPVLRPGRASTRWIWPEMIVVCALSNADVSENRFSTKECSLKNP
jgi:hypothetical protein